jgi:hypothetical protein
MVGRGGRFGHCSRILPVWKWPLRRLSRGSMVERDFRLTGEGRASSTEFPSFRTQRACESHRIEPSQLMGALMEHCSHMWTCTLCGLLAGLGAQSDLDRLLPMSHSAYRVQSGRRCLAAALMRPRRKLQECGRKGGEHCLNHESGVKLTGRPQRQLAQGLRNSTSHRGCGHSQSLSSRQPCWNGVMAPAMSPGGGESGGPSPSTQAHGAKSLYEADYPFRGSTAKCSGSRP